ncbi:type I methionyl aminopeptidase [Gloeobacter kilaueensis]|uniref:Methionine aminopeptidase n=1 Tax=Gloeobacter kilaueensis (strain ATCC BAA-2537 / CCAP 1431/1 / ULC 316 / JS1) TaxID=1183438 RepID=U5QJK6_GLOK1|nr:type I methionyl aminopeptidase [Gloeobacter kilaueensis]AGY57825.1 methionine aminopeptidase [Gloeobacter kilaueensis JS1]
MELKIPKPVEIKSAKEIEKLRAAGRLAAELLDYIEPFVKPGVSTEELDRLCAEWTRAHGATSAPLGYHGYPKHICTSVNHVVCHGIPNKKQLLKEGDIINIDVTPILDGWHGDSSKTFCVGKVSELARRLVETTYECLMLGIAEVKPGARVGDIGAAIQAHAEAAGFSVVRDFVGHGIGKIFHTEPWVPHYGTRGKGTRLRPGMVFTIEPMINAGSWETKVLADKWTAITADGSLSAQFEHTVAVTETGVEILTRR